MKRILFVYLLISWCTIVFCQTGRITGTAMDAETKTPLELATVSILNQDSSFVTYQLSDKNGKFTIEKLPLKKKLLLSISYTGYVAHYSAFELATQKTDTIVVFLALNTDTNAVVVTSTIPIRMNGDTLEINPAAFKMKGDAVVEELLNQVAGITIWSDGTITVNGKKVQNLFVDGKPFMGSTDSRVVTQNLPKTAIDKIQLYQEYDRSKIGQTTSQPKDSVLTMNIKLKENSKKGYFGKVGVGYGTTERFESDFSFQTYNKRSSAGIGGGFNNINKNIGNLRDMFQNNTYRNYNPNLYNVGRFETNGINKNHSIGGVFTHSFIETANSRQNNRVAINYNKSGVDAYVNSLKLQNFTTIANSQRIREEAIQNNRSDRHDLGINYVKTNSYNDNLNVNGTASSRKEEGNSSQYTEVTDTANRLQSTNASNTLQNQQSDNESVNGSFAKSDNEDPLKSFTIQFDGRRGNTVSETAVKSVFKSLTDASKNTSYNRHYSVNNNFVAVGGTLDYSGFKRMLLGRYNLFGVNLNFSQQLNYTRTLVNSKVSDYDSSAKQYISNGNLSNQNKRETLEYTPSLGLSKNFYKYSDVKYRSINVQVKFLNAINTDKNTSSFAKRNLDRNFQFFRYEGNINYNYQKTGKFQYYGNLYYTKNFEYPSIDQLYTIVDDINVYDTRIGNQYLKNRTNHTINLNGNFNTQNQKSVYSVNGYVNGQYNRSLNPVVDSIINQPSGKRISYYINGDKSNNLNLNYSINVSRKLKKNRMQLMYNGQFGNSKFPNYIDSRYNISETVNLFNQLTLQFSLRSILIVDLGQSLQHYKTRQTAAGLTSFKNSNSTTKLGVVLNYPANFTFSSTIENIDNSNLNKPVILWNSFATYRFMKQQGELKFSAMDLLKQYKNISNSVNAYGTSTRITNGLQQFFLFTFSYYPRKFGKTVIKKPGTI
ncbi:MAG: carboxypeptidase regulatory-like domain-containing protein [Ferruginibacter sp.]